MIKRMFNWKSLVGTVLSVAVGLSLFVGLTVTSPRITFNDGYIGIEFGSRVYAAPPQLVANINYKNFKTDREKLDALESIIQQYIDYYNEIGEQHKQGLVTDEQWYVFAVRPNQFGGNVFDQHLLPLLQERNALRLSVRRSFYTDEQWRKLTDIERYNAYPLMYGDKQETRQQPTKATIDLLDKLKAVDVNSLSGELPPDPYENWTSGWTESDPASDVTMAANEINVDTLTRTPNTYVMKSYGAGHFGDFEHLVDCKPISYSNPDAIAGFWGLGNSAYTWGDMDSANHGLWCGFYYGYYRLHEFVSDNDDWYEYTDDTRYYNTIARSSTTLTCKIYSDATRETLLDTLSVACENTTFEHLMSVSSRDSGSGSESITFNVYNLDLQEVSEPDISNSPSGWAINGITGNGAISTNTTYYSNPNGDTTPPNSTVADGDCHFTLTNDSTVDIDIAVTMTDFSGGDANMTNSNDGSNGATSYGAYAWYSGMTYSNKVIVRTSGSATLWSSSSPGDDIKWGIEVLTRTDGFTGPSMSQATITITASAS